MKFWKSTSNKANSGNGFQTGHANNNPKNFGSLDRYSTKGHQQQQQHLQRRSCHGTSLGSKIRARLSGSSHRNSRETSATNDDIYEDFNIQNNSGRSTPNGSFSPATLSYGTTFVELIKRHGTRLGVSVTVESPPRISDLALGSWARRSDVLCVGDRVMSVNGVSSEMLGPEEVARTLEAADRVQLEVRYPLPPLKPSKSKCQQKVIQVTLRKENGSFGMVLRGGGHENARMCRPFTVSYITPGGPAAKEGNLRVNDRIKAVNGIALEDMKLPELQGLLYQQERDCVFTVEYDVAKHERLDCGPVLVEIRRDPCGGDALLGFGLNKCTDTGYVFVESVKQASLADRCGAIHLLSVNGTSVSRLTAHEATNLVRSSHPDDSNPSILQLEILPGIFSRSSQLINSALTPGNQALAMPMTPSFATMREQRGQAAGKVARYRSMTEIDRRSQQMQTLQRPPPVPPLTPQVKERRNKFVTFTVELQRDGGPLGLTLATEEEADTPGPIFISGLVEDGLADRTKTIQVGDQLMEINNVEVKNRCLNNVIPMLQQTSLLSTNGSESGDIIRLKLARLLSIPERDFTCLKSSSGPSKPPLPSPGSRTATARLSGSSTLSRRDSREHNRSPTPTNTVSLLPMAGGSSRASGSPSRPVPLEVHKVTLFKDPVYEDFGFSVSDGLYEKGIFINRIRRGGPADACGLLQPLDRILQINDARTTDFDCCLAVPLIAAAGDKIDLLVARTSKIYGMREDFLAPSPSPADTEGGTLTRATARQSQRHSRRLSRTNSADGRLTGGNMMLGGSVTNQVMPWTPGNVRKENNGLMSRY